ncbi:pilus assembly PilX family protein [Chitinimonas sp. PSY-7]|uniref:PilX N-terminal domain-containing pilus assembly protein n=1 Tax=Chitinimonas sp. PSY-7 TaxID=3459088 RepID=UPI00403FFEC2
MTRAYGKQSGFVLIVALGFLAVMTVLVLTTMVGTIQSEKMSGSHMQRNRAFQAAERALRQGEVILRTSGDKCVSAPFCVGGTADFPNGSGVGAEMDDPLTAFPLTDVAVKKWDIATGTKEETSYKLLINHLKKPPAGSKKDCTPYSIMGHGLGAGSSAEVVLQMVVVLCPQS